MMTHIVSRLRRRSRQHGFSRRSLNRGLRLEQLESRRLLAAQPSVILQTPSEVFLGETFQLTARFDNVDTTDPGFGPFIDLYIPVNGVDGVGGLGADGLSVVGGATYLGVPVTTTILTFPDDGGGTGTVLHPYAVDMSDTPLSVTGVAGDQLVVVQLPFGSFTAGQPTADVTLNMTMSSLADLNLPLNLRARAGFQFGNTPLDDPSTDPSLLSDPTSDATTWTNIASVEPVLLTLVKNYLGPEDETATGPNFPRQYEIVVDIANGQTITDLDISDLLPNNLVLESVDAITPSGTTTTFPTTPANAPANELIVNVPSVTGTAGANDATVLVTFHVPFRDADNSEVVSSVSGDDATSLNQAAALGDWTPTDTRDPSGTDNAAAGAAGPEHTLFPKSIAVQKSLSLFSDPDANGFSPGDTVEFTLAFQVSDFFGFSNIVFDDIIADGHRFDASFTPTLDVVEHGTASSGAIAATNFTVIDHFTGGSPEVGPIVGTQQIVLRVSDELVTRSLDPILQGGLVPVGGTGGADPNAAAFDAGATTGTITFRTIVQEDYSDIFPSGDSSVDERDLLSNAITVSGDVLSYADLSLTGESEADTSSAGFAIASALPSKSIYAVNGMTSPPPTLILSPGDEVTYRLGLALPTSDVENLQLVDYLPLPVLSATEVATFVDTVDGSVPAAGAAKFGPDDTFRALYGTTPGLSTDSISNSVSFNFGDFDAPSAPPSMVDLLFTVTVSDAPYADGLFLTNQVRRTQATTGNNSFADDAIVQIQLGEPQLAITKGVVATDNPNAVFSPPAVGPVTFSSPGSAGYRGAGTINSAGVAGATINSNIANVDAGDLVTFAIVIENSGSSRKGAFDVRLRDALPSGFVVPVSGPNLSVTDGAGDSIGITTIGGGLFDAAGGIELIDPGPTTQPDGTDTGAIDEFDATDGRNLVVITFDLQATTAFDPNQIVTNTATLFHYTGSEGGPDFTTSDLSDVATAQFAPMSIDKSIVSTNEASTNGNDVAIGEIVTYSVSFTIPEGTADSVRITDVPDTGLSIVDVISVTPSSGDLSTSIGSFAAVQAAANISANGDSVTLDFGTLTNANRDNNTAETIAIEYRVVALNAASNNRGAGVNNLSTLAWTGGADMDQASDVTIVEPTLNVQKTISPTTGQANDTFAVTLDISHTGGSDADAFNVELTDVLPAELSFAGNLNASGLAPSTLSEVGGTVVASWNTFPAGSSSQLTFNVTLQFAVEPSEVITNSATVTWTSLPGDVTSAQSSDPASTERTGDNADPGGTANDYSDTGNDSLTVAAPVVNKSVVSTNQLHTSGTDVVIGELVTYRTVVTIPQSTLPNSQLVDTPTAGLALVDVLAITASAGLSTDQGTFTDVANNAVIPGDGSSVTLDFGTLTNSDTDSGVDETITVDYRAVVLNTTTNDRGDALDNGADFSWGTSNTVSASAADLTIVEPALNVTKSIVPTTGQAADTFTVTIDLSHTAASDTAAQNLVLTDLLPGGMSFAGNLVSSAGVAPTTLVESGGTVTATWDELALASTAQIEFDVTLDVTVEPLDAIQNDADISWTSAAGDVTSAQSSNPLSVERTGDTSDPGGAANDHNDTASDSVTIISPLLSKSISNTNQLHTSGFNVAIGELITYDAVITVPQGTLTLARLMDVPDAGLSIVDVVGITASSGVATSVGTFADVANNAVVAADGSSVSFDFGSITNSDTNSGVAEIITVQYRASVLNSATNNRGDIFDNNVGLTWSGSQAILADAENVTVVEPELTVAKSIVPATGQAADTFTVTIDISHSAASDTAAQDVVLSDALPSGMSFAGNLTSTGGVSPTTLGEAGGTVTISWDEITPASTAQIEFDVTLDVIAEPNEIISNQANVTWTSVQGDVTLAQGPNALSTERTGDPSDPGGAANDHANSAADSVTVISPTFSKSVLVTNQIHTSGTAVAIGELVTYRAVVTVPQGTLPNADLVDTPTSGLAIVDVLGITASAGLGTDQGTFTDVANNAVIPADGSSVTLDFGTITNSDTDSGIGETITIDYRAVVLNTTTNDRADTLDNDADFRWGASNTISANADDLTIVEPDLVVTVSNATPSVADAGDVVTFTIDVAHAPASDADALDVSLLNLINSVANHLQYEPGSLSMSTTGSPSLLTSSDTGGDLQIAWSQFPLGATATITFQARLENTAPPLTQLSNQANLTWTSLVGDVSSAQSSNPLSVERTGDPSGIGGAANDHIAQDAGFVQTDVVQATKIVLTTSDPATGSSRHDPIRPDLAVGEVITYSIIAVLLEGTTPLVITDQLPTANGTLSITDVQVARVGANLAVQAGLPSEVRSDTDGDLLDDRIVLDFGTIVNSADGLATIADEIEVQISAEVVDVADNFDGQVVVNTSTVDFGAGQFVNTAETEIVEPDLLVNKTINTANGPAGSTLLYTVTVSHAGSSTADAYDLSVGDVLSDVNLMLVPQTVTSSAGSAVVSGNASGETTVDVTAPTLALGDTLTVMFEAVVNPDLGSGVVVNNTSDVTWDSQAGPGGRVGTDDDPATFTTTPAEIDLSITKVDDVDPVVIDDILVYSLAVTNLGVSSATGVTVTDTLPATVSYQTSNSSQGTTMFAGGIVTADIGVLRPNESATVTIEVQAPDSEQTLVNNASITANETDTVPSNNSAAETTEVVATSNLSGRVFVDPFSDGSFDAGDVALAGVEIRLVGINNLGLPVDLTTTTAADGTYLFTDLRPGDYELIQTQPALYIDGTDYTGSEGGTVPSSNRIALALPAGVDAIDYIFTELGLLPTGLSKRMLFVSGLPMLGAIV